MLRHLIRARYRQACCFTTSALSPCPTRIPRHRFCTTQQQQRPQSPNLQTPDYDTLLQCLRPEMAERVQQLIDHETYLRSLSQQIADKKAFLAAANTESPSKSAQQSKRVGVGRGRDLRKQASNAVLHELSHNDNAAGGEQTSVIDEPGLDLQELSGLKLHDNTFYGPNPAHGFDQLDLDKHLVRVLADMGMHMPSHIQQLSIPQILAGHNCVIGAETGTGKTLAYVLPLIQKLLRDTSVTQAQFEPISKFKEQRMYLAPHDDADGDDEGEDSDDDGMGLRPAKHRKRHPFEFDAEKKYPCCVILQPSSQLCYQTQLVVNEVLDRYYDAVYMEQRDNDQFYKLKTMSLHGRSLLPKSNELMPDILITTPMALLTNVHKSFSPNRYRAFVSKIRHIVLDEADYIVRKGTRHQVRYLFGKLKELRKQIEANPLKYKLLLPRYLREESFGATPSLLYRELQKIGRPQMVFVGATIPTHGKRTVAEEIKEWLDRAVWIRTPGLHQVCNHIAQQFRFVPAGMEQDVLQQTLIEIAREHLYKVMFESDDDVLFNRTDEKPATHYESGKLKKHRRRKEKEHAAERAESTRQQKQLNILIFINTKQGTRECYKNLLRNGWLNVRCVHNQLHREERKQRISDFENGVPCTQEEATEKSMRKNIAVNDAINRDLVATTEADVNKDEFEWTSRLDTEYKEVVNHVHVLVTSDFSNRGIDFKNVQIVINCQFPFNAMDYLHRCGRTGRGDSKDDGRVISFFNEHDLDLAWHVQMSLLNQYKSILRTMDEETKTAKEMDPERIGTTSVQLDDCFGEKSMGEILREYKGNKGGYHRMSVPRDHDQKIDLTRVDLDEMDEGLVRHVMRYAKQQKWVAPLHDQETKESSEEWSKEEKEQRQRAQIEQLKKVIADKKEGNRKLTVPWPYRLEHA